MSAEDLERLLHVEVQRLCDDAFGLLDDDAAVQRVPQLRLDLAEPVCAAFPASASERVATLTIELLTRITGHTDDVTVLAAQRRTPPPALELRLRTAPDAPRLARTALRDWLQMIGPGVQIVEVLLRAATELVANVVDHAHLGAQGHPFEMRAQVQRDGIVRIEVVDHGGWKLPVITERRGRGLAIVRRLVDQLTIERSEHGTTAILQHALTRPAGLRERPAPVVDHDPEHFDVFSEGGPQPVVTVIGPLDATTAAETAAHLDLALTEAGTAVTVDLTLVSLLASAGVDLLWTIAERARALGLDVDLIAPNGTPAQHVLDLVRLPHQHAVTALEQR